MTRAMTEMSIARDIDGAHFAMVVSDAEMI